MTVYKMFPKIKMERYVAITTKPGMKYLAT